MTTLDGLDAEPLPAERVERMLATGKHPATRLPLADEGTGTCGTCIRRVGYRDSQGDPRTRCALVIADPAREDEGPRLFGTWPACSAYAPSTTGRAHQTRIHPDPANRMRTVASCACGQTFGSHHTEAAAVAESQQHVEAMHAKAARRKARRAKKKGTTS